MLLTNLGKRLAAIEKKDRDTAFAALSQWLPAQSTTVSDLDLLKLCKALYYSFWLSDKPLVQQELAENDDGGDQGDEPVDPYTAAAIVGLRYIHAFWQIIIAEWPSLDKHRINKYYYLFRQLHKSTFAVLEKTEWSEDVLDVFMSMMVEGPLNATESRIPDSIRYHTIEVYMDMLEQTVTTTVPPHVFTTLMMPFVFMLGESRNRKIHERIQECVIDRLTQLVDREASECSSASSDSDDEDDDAPPVLKSTHLQIYFPDIVSLMFDVASHPETPVGNRKRLYGLVKAITERYDISLVDGEAFEAMDQGADLMALMAAAGSSKQRSGRKRAHEDEDDESDEDEAVEGAGAHGKDARWEDLPDLVEEPEEEGDESSDSGMEDGKAHGADAKWEDLPSCSSDEETPEDYLVDELIAPEPGSDQEAEEDEAPEPGARNSAKSPAKAKAEAAPPAAAETSPAKSVQFCLDRNEVKPFNKAEPTSRLSLTRVVKEPFPAPELLPTMPAPKKAAGGKKKGGKQQQAQQGPARKKARRG
ncbi:nucleolar protein,Nop52-domain-containing protein [Catenaria anguillulae PL171]|uniref:Nucleolar protein,Nop52-domain-containing protein n=1 Tax=Catenaria anguillulae PL171 TaxID=765915 RepID=A0A1Y2HC07_9FUNG|nr:nucleolar protein,Nop52-domain-containing protein [Catenaria anguillulae PL171]